MGSFSEIQLKGLYQNYLKKQNKKKGKTVDIDEEGEAVQIDSLECDYSTTSIYEVDVSSYVPILEKNFDE